MDITSKLCSNGESCSFLPRCLYVHPGLLNDQEAALRHKNRGVENIRVRDCINGTSCKWKPNCNYHHPEGYYKPADLMLMLQDHVRRISKLVKDSKDPSKRPTVPADFKTRPLCKIKVSGSNQNWTTYSVADAENRITTDFPHWNKDLISCPPGILYDERQAIKLYDRARDLVVKNNHKLSFLWMDKIECDSYRNRFGLMGETLVQVALDKEVRGNPALLLCGFKVWLINRAGKDRDGLETEPQNDTLGFASNQNTLVWNTEHDLALVVPNGFFLDLLFIQVKTIEDPNPSLGVIVEKATKAVEQTERDFTAFLAIHPDICPQQAAKLRVRTYVALPATMRPPWDTNKNILYRDDFNSLARDEGSVVENLHSDTMAQSSIKPGGSLASKMELTTMQPPTKEILDLYKTITARYVGVGSIHPMKDHRTFFTELLRRLQALDEAVGNPATLEKALHLDTWQAAAANCYKTLLIGFYGTGKTVTLEALVWRALADTTRFPNPNIVIIVWEESKALLKRFKEHFKDEAAVKVMGINKACKHYGIKEVKCWRTEEEEYEYPAVTLSDLCSAMSSSQRGHSNILMADEVPSRGDFRQLQIGTVNAVISIAPATEEGSPVEAPADMKVLELTRVYRSTKRILDFLSLAMVEWQVDDQPYPYTEKMVGRHVNVSLGQEISGHELLGDEVECVLLPMCACGDLTCNDPVQHLLEDRWTLLLHLLIRLKGHVVEARHITVMMDTAQKTPECQAWMERKLGALPWLAEVRVTTLEQWRGMESEILVWFGDGSYSSICMMDSCSRVTAGLVLVTPQNTKSNGMWETIILAVQQGRARWAQEQLMVPEDELFYKELEEDSWKKT